MAQVKFTLDELESPTHWYNVVADMPNPPAPPLGPDGKPLGADALSVIFPPWIIEKDSGEDPVFFQSSPATGISTVLLRALLQGRTRGLRVSG